MQKLDQVRCFLLDLDGTFYLGSQLLPGALDFIRQLEKNQTQYLFLTNNSSKSRREYVEKLERLGLSVPEEKIFTSGEATALYLSKQKPGANLFVVGTPALEAEFERHGFTLTQVNPDYAVLGFDTTLTYQKIHTLCDLVVSGIPYIATHPDINCPTETGFMPDIGSMIAMIYTSVDRYPDLIIGKPHQPIVEAIVTKLGIPVEQLAMVGDRLYTDIALGRTGLTTILVLSGETQMKDLPASEFKPDYIMQNLAELAAYLSQTNPSIP